MQNKIETNAAEKQLQSTKPTKRPYTM